MVPNRQSWPLHGCPDNKSPFLIWTCDCRSVDKSTRLDFSFNPPQLIVLDARIAKMPSKQPQTSLFQVYLRLRPPIAQRNDDAERFLAVEPPETSQDDGEIVAPVPTHITLQPPSDSRKRAVEKFGFTKVFEESASQLDIFHDTGMESIVRGVLKEGRDGLVATLGVTGSGKVRYSLTMPISGISAASLTRGYRVTPSLDPNRNEESLRWPLMLSSDLWSPH